MKQIISLHGWPGKTLVGEDGAFEGWLLVQHADLDHAFQKRCLEFMAAAGAEEVSHSNLAYLVDRVLLAEDEALVDERRASAGLGTLAEYKKTMMDIYQKDRLEQDASAEQSQT